MSELKFYKGNYSAFTADGFTKNAESVYFTSDEKRGVELWLGDKQVGGGKYTLSSVTSSDENVKEAYALVDPNTGEQIGQTIKVYKDSSLSGVTYDKENQKLVFNYVLANGSSSTVDVDMSDLVGNQEFTAGLDVQDGQVSVKLGSSEASNKNFLSFDEDNDSLAVRSMDADVTVLTEDIEVATEDGNGVGNYADNTVIKAGSNIYDILKNILSKEAYPKNVTTTSASAHTTMNDLTLALDYNNNAVVEVGTEVSLVSGKTNGVNFVEDRVSSIKGMEHGYSTADNNTQEYSAKTIVVTTSSGISESSKYSYTTTITGFNAANSTATDLGSGSTSDNIVIRQTAIGYATEGENKVEFKASGRCHTYSAPAIDKVYYCSNIKNTDPSKTAQVDAVSDVTTAPTKSASVKVIGKYKCFIGYSTKSSGFTSDEIRGLTEVEKYLEYNTENSVVDGIKTADLGKNVIIAYPNTYQLTAIDDNFGFDLLSNAAVRFSEATVNTGGITTTYTVFALTTTVSDTKFQYQNVIIKKK